MRCFFHLVTNGDEILDETGTEVASIDEAQTEALKAIDELRREDQSQSRDWRGWSLKIANEEGRVLSTIPLTPSYQRALKLDRVDDPSYDPGTSRAEPH
jgi:hypothetical protein